MTTLLDLMMTHIFFLYRIDFPSILTTTREEVLGVHCAGEYFEALHSRGNNRVIPELI